MVLEEFRRQFHIKLNGQQMDAVTAVNGSVLLLAVPGSGKTTVLVTRLGYMIYCCGISPESVLMLTYTRAAARDMSERFASIFGPEILPRMNFRTINSICDQIIRFYASNIDGRQPFRLESNEKALNGLISCIYQETESSYPTENDIHNIRTLITYIKNMELGPEEINVLDSKQEYDISKIYEQYQNIMRNNRRMDYDDQMVYALNILRRSPDTINFFRSKYQYICVDEAQDTSKIQHTIIALLAGENDNLFMVGDEDQSIYGFRAAYPDALLSFSNDHKNARVLLMEENFRSVRNIVEASDRFISKNIFRHKKQMKSCREKGPEIRNISVKSRAAQYTYLLKVSQGLFDDRSHGKNNGRTAVLYRNNESAIPLIDILERNQVPYRTQNQDLLFFTHRTVMDIHNIIAFCYDGYNTDAFLQIYYKIGMRITKKEAETACRTSASRHIPILDALEMINGLGSYKLSRARSVRTNIRNMLAEPAGKALGRIMKALEYKDYLENTGISDEKINILKILAYKEASLKTLNERLEWLKERIMTRENDPECPLILSTIHSSKGLEYEQVFLIDCTDGIFPNAIPNKPFTAKNKNNSENNEVYEEWKAYEEERRMFYVAITRAKDSLSIFSVQNCEHTFTDELFGIKNDKKRDVKTSYTTTNYFYNSRTKRKSYVKSESVTSKMPEEEFDDFYDKLGHGIPVIHSKFGEGVVSDIDRQSITIHFEDGGEKTFNLQILYEKGLLDVK